VCVRALEETRLELPTWVASFQMTLSDLHFPIVDKISESVARSLPGFLAIFWFLFDVVLVDPRVKC